MSADANSTLISFADYQEFEKNYIFDALAGVSLGRAFCDKYGIGPDCPLYHFKDNKFSENWIKDHFIV
jgi:hypothetical protein